MSAPPIYRAEWKVLHEGQVYSVVATEGRTCTYDQAEEAIAFHRLHAPTGYLVNMGRGLVLHLDHLGAWPSRDDDLGTAVVQRGEETLRQVDATLDGCARPYLDPHLVKVPRTGVRGDGPGLISNEKTWKPVDQATPQDVLDWDALRAAPDVEAPYVGAMRAERQRRLNQQAARAQLEAEVQAAVSRFIDSTEARP